MSEMLKRGTKNVKRVRVLVLGLVLNQTTLAVLASTREKHTAHVNQPLGLILAQTDQPGYVQAAVTYGRELSCIFIADATFTSSLHWDVNIETFI